MKLPLFSGKHYLQIMLNWPFCQFLQIHFCSYSIKPHMYFFCSLEVLNNFNCVHDSKIQRYSFEILKLVLLKKTLNEVNKTEWRKPQNFWYEFCHNIFVTKKFEFILNIICNLFVNNIYNSFQFIRHFVEIFKRCFGLWHKN